MPVNRQLSVNEAPSRRVERALLGVACVLSFALGFVGCRDNGLQQEATPAASINAPAIVQNSGAHVSDTLITEQQIGRARLGTSVGELKRLFPGAKLRVVTLPDTPSAVALQQSGEDLFYFNTNQSGEAQSDKLPADMEVVSFLMTKNPRYATAAGIRPGSSLDEAEKTYGPVQLYYSPDAEYAKFTKHPASEIGFWVTGAEGKKSAGVYRMMPDELEGGFYRSTKYSPGSKIWYISIASDGSEKEKAQRMTTDNQQQSSTAHSITQLQGGTRIEPGRRVGQIKIGAAREAVHRTLGKPDGAYRVANGIAGEYWSSETGNQLRIFYQGGKVVQISVQSAQFSTSEGITTGSSLDEVRQRHPTLKKFSHDVSGSGGGLIDYYDDVQQGIAFEFTTPNSPQTEFKHYAIIVHQPGRRVIADADEKPRQE